MAESLLGLGELTNQALQLGQFHQRQRSIQEAHDIDREQLAERQRQDRTRALLGVATNKLFEGGPVAARALQEIGRENKFIITDDEATVGHKALAALFEKADDPDASHAEKLKVFNHAQLYVPSLTRGAIDNWTQFQAADDTHMKRLLEMDKLKPQIDKLNREQRSIQDRQGVYSTIGGLMNRLIDTTTITDTEGKRSFDGTFKKLINAKDDIERKLLLSPVKDLDGKMRQQASSIQEAFAANYQSLNQFLRPIASAVEQAEAEGKEVDPQDLAKVKTLELLDNAKEAVDAWTGNPYDKKHWNRLNTTLQQVRLAAAETKKELSGLDSARQGMLQNAIRRTDIAAHKQELEETAGKAQNFAQQQFIELVSGGMSADKAAAQAGRTTKDMFGVYPDSSKFKDPKLANTLGIREMTTAVETDVQRGLIATESAMNMIGHLENVVATSNIGLGAMIKSNVYGLSEQISATAKSLLGDAQAMKAADPKGMKDFTPSKWFDPNIPKVDLLAHNLAMALIKSEQGSRPSDKDMALKVKSLGLQTVLANTKDARVRLKTLREQMEYQRNVYSRLAGKFADRVHGSGEAGGAPTTAAEYFKRKGITIPTEEETQ